MTPHISVKRSREYRRCYGCGGEAAWEIEIGHRSDNGRNGNSHSIALCDGEVSDLATALLSRKETAR